MADTTPCHCGPLLRQPLVGQAQHDAKHVAVTPEQEGRGAPNRVAAPAAWRGPFGAHEHVMFVEPLVCHARQRRVDDAADAR